MNEEQQWQECLIKEATHAMTSTGNVYELKELFDHYCIHASQNSCVYDDSFADLGIKPVRKAETKPIEITGRVSRVRWHRSTGSEVTIQLGDEDVSHSWVGMLMKVVEVQP